MDLEDFLRLHGADLDQLVEGAQAVAPMQPGDRLIAVGSLAEGLGNRKSDVDLLLVTPRREHGGASPDEVLSFAVGQCIVDMRIVPAALASGLRSRLGTWAQGGWNLMTPSDFNAGELLLLHRLGAGLRLWCAPEAGVDEEDARLEEDIARLKLHVARHLARTLQVDMVGYCEVGDHQSMVYSAQDLLGHAVDGLLAGFRLTNPTPKWRSRLLDRLPADWESRLVLRPSGLRPSDLVWRLHRAPAEPTAAACLEHACRIVTFARAAFVWAEDSLVHAGAKGGRRYVWPQLPVGSGEHPLPFLALDVDFSRTEEGVVVGRLNEFGKTLHMSFDDFAVMLLFDNATTAREAALVIEQSNGVEQFVHKVRRSGFDLAA
ncbi:MAG: hypothetical protein QOH04_1019 [Sphingomonadales bacterium]|jgi:hypothetical protein|nr:hypothetical protein [Sphingomonadales bacterium]